jgi:hypothetical protein
VLYFVFETTCWFVNILPKFVNAMNGHIVDGEIKAFRSAHTTIYVYDF